MKRIEIHVVYVGRSWWVTVGGLRLRNGTQRIASLVARDLADLHAHGGGKAEVLIHRRNGTIGERNTYPRSSDPRRSRG